LLGAVSLLRGGHGLRAAEVTLAWNPPLMNTDDSPLTDLSGHVVYWRELGGSAASGTVSVDASTNSAMVVGLDSDTIYAFSVSAVNSHGVESARTPELILTPSVGVASHACDGYRWSETGAVVNCEFLYPADSSLASLVWVPELPQGWQLGSAAGHGAPDVEGTNIVFRGELTNCPVQFAYTVAVPAGAALTNQLAGKALVEFEGRTDAAEAVAWPDPLPLQRYHSADFRPPFWVVDGGEVNRVLGYLRAGGYTIQPGSSDGYRATTEPETNAVQDCRHTADFKVPVGEIDGSEVNRVLAYWRAGGYGVQPGSVDGYEAIAGSAAE